MTIENKETIAKEFQENKNTIPKKFTTLYCRTFDGSDEEEIEESKTITKNKLVDERYTSKTSFYSVH